MPALYEDVETFFGDIFAKYGRFLFRHTIPIMTLSFVLSLLLGLGLLQFEHETRVEELYTPSGSQALADKKRVENLFPGNTSDNFYSHQLTDQGKYAEVIITSKMENKNVLRLTIFLEIIRLENELLSLTFKYNNATVSFQDVCARRHKDCSVDGESILMFDIMDECLQVDINDPDLMERHEDRFDLKQLSGARMVNGCVVADALRLRYNLRQDDAHQRELAEIWEREFVKHMKSFISDAIECYYGASISLDSEMDKDAMGDLKYFALTFLIMTMYASISSSGGGDCVAARGHLARAGVIASILAIFASFGLVSLCKVKIVDAAGVTPFLVLGVGVDHMFLLMSGWRQTNMESSLEDRIAQTFKTSATSLTITSLTDLLSFCIGATSPFLGIRNFCIYTGVSILFCYINVFTMFGGILVLNAKRVQASRHYITCLPTKSKEQLEEDGKSRLFVFCCAGRPPTKRGEDDTICERFPPICLPKVILNGPTKCVIILIFGVYIALSMWGASNIQEGLKLEEVLPKDSYFSKYVEANQKYFYTYGPPISFIISKPVEYWKPSVQAKINKLLKEAHRFGHIESVNTLSWLDQYIKFGIENKTKHTWTRETFISGLRRDFLPRFPRHVNDIRFSDDFTAISASRVYVFSYRLKSSIQESEMMLKIRQLAHNTTIRVFAFSPEFLYYEHYVSIMKNTLLAVGVAVIGMLFVAIMFIPHPVSVICVTVTMVTIVLGMFGFMHFWGLALSAITSVQIILSVGFCVDFTVHISHAFMQATGKNRNERVSVALQRVGVPILNGATSSILGILMLAFANSYIFQSFFKTMFLVMVFGLMHSLLLLPVIFSFVGPRRTNKPRRFIPVSELEELTTKRSSRHDRSDSNVTSIPLQKHRSRLDSDVDNEISDKTDDFADKETTDENTL